MKYDVEEEGIELGSVVNKESNTGLMSNKRLLVLKSGCLYYYSTVPKAFKGNGRIMQVISKYSSLSRILRSRQSTSPTFITSRPIRSSPCSSKSNLKRST